MKKSATVPEAVTLPQQRYIESIAALVERKGQARTSDIAETLGVSLPSVSEAVSRLVRLGFARRRSRHEIDLTRRGNTIAAQLDRRHQALQSFMIDVMAMDGRKADSMACCLEHLVSREFVDRLLVLNELIQKDSDCRHKKTWRRRIQRTVLNQQRQRN